MSPERKVAVVTDSCASAPKEFAEKRGVIVVPQYVNFTKDDGTIESLSDFDFETPEQLYEMMREAPELPKTAAAPAGEFLEVYKELAEKTDEIISTHIISSFSKIFEHASLAASYFETEPELKEINPELTIEVVDSGTVSAATWILAEKAAQLAGEGKDLETIKTEIIDMIPSVNLLAVLDTLENLKRGGRISGLEATLGSFIQIKPILQIKEGELKAVEKPRTTKKARRRLFEMVEERKPLNRVIVIHANDLEGAKEAREQLKEFYPGEIDIFPAGSALGVHAGERAIGVGFLRAKTST